MSDDRKEDLFFVSESRNMREMVTDVAGYPFQGRRTISQYFCEDIPEFVCVYNAHPLNTSILRLAKKYYPKGVRSIYLHEPDPLRVLPANGGLFRALYLKFLDRLQAMTVASTTDVILPSPFSRDLFRKRFPMYNGKTHLAPLLVPSCQRNAPGTRKFFSMVGQFNFSKRPDLLIDMANLASLENLDLEFLIATASNIDVPLSRLYKEGSGRLTVIRKEHLSDADINAALSESYAVCCLHPNVTQSGVLPVAFMNSVPVIAPSDPGFSQYIDHRKNGWLLPRNFVPRDLLEAMLYIKEHFSEMSANASKTYDRLFSPHRFDEYYFWLLDRIGAGEKIR